MGRAGQSHGVCACERATDLHLPGSVERTTEMSKRGAREDQEREDGRGGREVDRDHPSHARFCQCGPATLQPVTLPSLRHQHGPRALSGPTPSSRAKGVMASCLPHTPGRSAVGLGQVAAMSQRDGKLRRGHREVEGGGQPGPGRGSGRATQVHRSFPRSEASVTCSTCSPTSSESPPERSLL